LTVKKQNELEKIERIKIEKPEMEFKKPQENAASMILSTALIIFFLWYIITTLGSW
jgi:hypothetical protein